MNRFCYVLSALALLALALGDHAFADEQARIIEGSAQVIDGDTLEIESEHIRLLDIDAPELAQTCIATIEQLHRCGEAAADALAARIDRSPVTCRWDSRDDYGRVLAHCLVDNEDLSAWSVRTGWSFAFVRYSTRLVEEERAARRERLGIWAADEVEEPWTFRQTRWNKAAEDAPDRCAIKGNVNAKGERIYHLPWSSRFYGRTRIDTSKGERWFCTENEAQAAGWRPAKR